MAGLDQFVDAAAADLHLAPGSAAVDAAPAGLVAEDFDGQARDVHFCRDEASPEELEGRLKQASWSAHASWEGTHAGVEGMYVWGELEAERTAARLPREGLFVMVWGKLQRFRPYFRYEYHDPDTDLDEDDATLILGGVNFR